MSDRKIIYTKDHRAKAKERDKAMFAIGYDGKAGGSEGFSWIDHKVGAGLMKFHMLLANGTDPIEAAKEAWGKEANDAR